jgi:hypothetical protein
MFNSTPYRPRPRVDPNPNQGFVEHIANQFLREVSEATEEKGRNLISLNDQLGGSPKGYTYAGLSFLSDPTLLDDKTLYLDPIHPSLEKDAEAFHLRASRLQGMRTKLTQALATILQRCNGDVQTFRDALPDELVNLTQLESYPRNRQPGFLLKAQPMLAATYRSIDDAIHYHNRYRLLD